MNNFLKKISVPTYLYALLIFIGYINYFTYYTFFGINIIDYLTFGELLLSFLNLTIPLLILGAFLLFILIFAQVSFVSKSKEYIEHYRETTYGDNTDVFKGSFKNIKAIFKNKKWKTFNTYFSLLLFTFQFIFSSIIFIFLIAYPFELLAHIFGGVFIYDVHPILLIILSFVWFMTFDDVLKRIFNEREIRSAIFNTSIILCFIGVITFINRSRAKNILENHKSDKVEFLFGQEEIKTDSTQFYIGQTQGYIFLRQIKDSATVIYSKSKIEKFKIIEK